MRAPLVLLLTLALASPALADRKGPKHRTGHAPHAALHCPPGLAKKNPPCVPPGQARHHGHHHGHDHRPHAYRVGDRIGGGYVLVPDPWRYGIAAPGTYWRVGDQVFRVDRDTGRILAVLGALTALVN